MAQKISRVEFDQGQGWCVGRNGVTSIEPYDENGHMAPIPYIRIWRGEEKVAEFSKDRCFVFYENAADKEREQRVADGKCPSCGGDPYSCDCLPF